MNALIRELLFIATADRQSRTAVKKGPRYGSANRNLVALDPAATIGPRLSRGGHRGAGRLWRLVAIPQFPAKPAKLNLELKQMNFMTGNFAKDTPRDPFDNRQRRTS